MAQNSQTVVRLSTQPKKWVYTINTKYYKPIETRILSFHNDKWSPYVYKWNAESSEAYLHPQGHSVPLDAIDRHERTIQFNYQIPGRPQCSECHGGYNELNDTNPLGPSYLQTNIEVKANGKNINQMAYWLKNGLLATDAKMDIVTLSREREYLHINCGHCHNQYGTANSSRLYLDKEVTGFFHLGFCKPSVAAGKGTLGLKYDIEPGVPEKSILIQRLKSTQASIKMPEIGRSLVDEHGVAMLENWIRQSTYSNNDCQK
ncbi:MAG: hypothetical protein P8Y45_14190 [Exilibacterium sp.]